MCEILHIHVAAVNHQCARMQAITRYVNERCKKEGRKQQMDFHSQNL